MKAAKPDTVILSVKLASGGFESSIVIPLDASQRVKDRAAQQWMETIQFALKMGVTQLSADFSDKEPE